MAHSRSTSRSDMPQIVGWGAMRDDAAVIARLRGAGCVFAEEEAALIACAARTPAELDDMVGQRVKGLPLEQVIGWAEFRGMRIFVAARVFVPRRRSEFLVEVAAGLARERDAAMSPVAPAAPSAAPSAPELARVIVDLCCGTGALASEAGGDLDEELAAAPRHEHPGSNEDPHAAKFRPADHLLKRQALDPLPDHVIEFSRGPRGTSDKRRLFLGENTPGAPQPGDHRRIVAHGTPAYYLGHV